MVSDTHTGAEQNARPDRSGQPPLFLGADRLYRLIGALYQRTRLGDRPRRLTSTETEVRWGEPAERRDRAGRKGLPMVCLVRPSDVANLLAGVDRLLTEAKRVGVPHVYLDFVDDTRPDDEQTAPDELKKADVLVVRTKLREIRNGLVRSRNARGRRLSFPLFTLVDSLMSKDIDENDQNPDDAVRRHLSDQSGLQRIRAAVRSADNDIPDQYSLWRIPLWLGYLITLGLYRARLTGRVPVLSGRYRWFLLQPHLAPEMSGTFVRFAERLVNREWQKEAPEYVARLLVNSFLEDLRRGYRLRPWQVRARRMTYPTLLLDNITITNGGYALLKLINTIRNQVGTFDPLLVVSASTAVPPDAGHRYHGRPQYEAIESATAYNAWQDRLLRDRRARQEIAWYLPIKVTAVVTDDDHRRAAAGLGAFGGFDPGQTAARPHWVVSRSLRIVVAVLLLVAAGGSVWRYQNDHCGIWGWYGWDINLHGTPSDCVGYTDGSNNPFYPQGDQTIQTVVETIATQNGRADQQHQGAPQRPFVTIVYLGALDTSGTSASALTAERESLAGVAVAQNYALNADSPDDPIVRVLIANAGPAMTEGPQVANQLRALAATDSSVIGVVGLDMSSQATARTVAALTNAGLPIVAAPLSEDALAPNDPMYFQVAPPNAREAQMVAEFAAEQADRGTTSRVVRVYYSADPNDTYSTNLRQDAESAFHDRGFTVDSVCYQPSPTGGTPSCPAGPAPGQRDQLVGDATAAGSDTCGHRGFVFFAGRGLPDYADFLKAAGQCPGASLGQTIYIGGDDVSRYVADPHDFGSVREVPFYYVSFAPTPDTQQQPANTFYTNLKALFPFESNPANSRSRDGHAAMSYDAAQVLLNAAESLHTTASGIPVTPGTVWRQIVARSFQGASGIIDYGRNLDQQFPSNKSLTIMRVAASNGEMTATVQATCGNTGTTPGPTLAHCP